MSYNFNAEKPIYLQIMEQIKMRIISRQYQANQRLPSVRELSFEFEVNPNTVQRALLELENMGLIFTERTNGKYVTTDELLIEDMRNKTIREMIDEFYDSMHRIGIDDEILQNIINERKIR